MANGFRWIIDMLSQGQWQSVLYALNVRVNGLDLEGVGLETLGLSEDHSVHYCNSGGPDLERVLKTLHIEPTDKIIDIGCGKGGVLITLAKYPFGLISGVDISPQLIGIAHRNINKMNIKNVDLKVGDATTYRDLDRYNYIFFYNPFPSVVMKSVVSNILASLGRIPRKITIIYKNPVCHEDILIGNVFCKTNEFCHSERPYYIYNNIKIERICRSSCAP